MAKQTVELPALKDFIFRPPAMEDAELVAELFNTHAVEVFGRVRYEPHDFEINWTAPGFDKDASVRLALTQQGQLVGYCFVSDNYEP